MGWFWKSVFGGLVRWVVGLATTALLALTGWDPKMLSGVVGPHLVEWLDSPFVRFPAVFALAYIIFKTSLVSDAKKAIQAAWFRYKPYGIAWHERHWLDVSGPNNDLKVQSMNACGANRTGRVLKDLSGYVKNLDTGEEVPLYMTRDGKPVLVEKGEILPDQVFWIKAPFGGSFGSHYQFGPHLSIAEWMRRWKRYEMVFRCDGKTYTTSISTKLRDKYVLEVAARYLAKKG